MIDTLKSLPLTFYSRAFYQYLLQRWTGIGVGFIFVLTLLGVISTAVTLREPVREGVEKIQTFLEAMPEMTMKDHKLSIDRPTPYTLKLFDMENEPNKLIIDPDHPINDVDALTHYMETNNVFMLVTSDKIVTAKDQGRGVQVDDLGAMPDGKLTHEQWAAFGTTIRVWAFPLILIFSAVFGFISTFVMVLFVAVIIKILDLLFKTETEFDGAMRLAAASGFPGGVLVLILPVSFWVHLAVWIAYAIFGLTTLRPKNPAAV